MKFTTSFYGLILLAASAFFGAGDCAAQLPVGGYAGLIEAYEGKDPASLPAETLYRLAAAHEEMQRYGEAIALFEVYRKREPEQVYVLNDLARTALKSGRMPDAVAYLEKAVAEAPEDTYLCYKLAETYYAAGNYVNGEETCIDLTDRGYDNPQVWMLMGQCSQSLGMIQAALSQYGEACRQNPASRTAALKYLNLLLNQPNADREYVDYALAICDSVLCYNRSDLDVRLAQGLLLFRSNDAGSAEFIFTELLEKGDSLPSVIRYGGLARVESGRNLEAQPLLKLAYERDTTDFRVLMALGTSNVAMNRQAEAEKYLDKAEETLRQEDRHYSIELARGNLHMYLRNWERAMQAYYAAYSRYNDRNVGLLTLCYRASLNLENRRETQVFLLCTLIRRCFETGHPIPSRNYYKTELGKVIENAFFESKETLPLRAPDGRTSTVHVDKLREMLNQMEN